MGSGGEVQRMARGWRGESQGGVVWRQAVWGLLMGLCVGAVAGAPAAMQPSSSSSDNGSNGAGGEVGCERPITDVLWGFGFSLLAIFLASWNTHRHSQKRKRSKVIRSLGVTLLGSILGLEDSYGGAFVCVPMVCHLLNMKKEMTIARIWEMLNPFSKSPPRFLATCDIIMYVQKGGESELIKHSWIWNNIITVEDETEAMVVGEEPDEKNQYVRKQLSYYGKVALFWGEYFSDCEEFKILPKYGQLKFLRANSGFAAIAIGIQAIGYIYAVIYRTAKDLRVAPVEVIGLVINFILLIGVILYGTSNPCARPLVIYMNNVQEGKFVNVLKSKKQQIFQLSINYSSKIGVGWFIVLLLLCTSILVYFIVTLRRTTNMMIVLPLIIFAISHLLSVVYFFLLYSERLEDILHVISFIICLSNIVVHVWAVIVTFYYWKSQHFNTRPELINLSQFIPFIG